MTTNQTGQAPYITDDTRRWVEAYRVSNKIKPALVFKAATDSNFINNLNIGLPCYSNHPVFCQAICNVVAPGQRLPGVLSWSATENLDNVVQSAQLTCLDALPVSKINTTITGFYEGTGSNIQGYAGGDNTIYNIGSTLPARWFSTRIRYQWVMNGLGISTQLTGNKPISTFFDATLAGNPYTTSFQEGNVNYRQFEPEVIQVSDLSQFPDPAITYNAWSSINPVDTEWEGPNEWWLADETGTLNGVGAYYVLVGQEIMRVTRIDRANNYIFVVPGGRGAAGVIQSHSVGDTVTLLGFGPYTSRWAGFGYLMPADYKVIQSPMRPGTCWVSYEGYGNPGDYINYQGQTPKLSKVFDRQNNMCFTGYWFTQSPQITLDNTGVPQLTITFQSAGYLLSEQKIDPNNIQRSKDTFYSWGKATFDSIGYTRRMPGDWYDFTQWDPTLPGAYPLTLSTEYAQHQAFFNHMNDTNNGEQCEFGHPKSTNVLTPKGWKKVGDLTIGDEVIGSDGNPIKIVNLHARGELPVYRVSFSDGVSVLTDGGHLWKAITSSQKHKGTDKYVIRQTRELKETLKRGWQIPLTKPVNFEVQQSEAPVDPYLLGLLLGDGYLGGGESSRSIILAAKNEKVVAEALKVLPSHHKLVHIPSSTKRGSPAYRITSGITWRRNRTLASMLKNLGLLGVRHRKKFIPDRYKFGSITERLYLLQGLVDTDGEVSTKHKFTAFYSTSKQLAQDVQFLVESLGGTGHLTVRNDGCYRVGIKLIDFTPVRAKTMQFRACERYPVTRVVKAIEDEGTEEVICLEVDAPDNLYLTEHCIVTHNCQAEWLQYVLQHEAGKPTGSIPEARVVGKHIYYESIRVFNLGGQFNAGPLKTYGRLMHALAMAAWDNPLFGNSLGTRWTKMPNRLFDNMVNFINGRVWNGQWAYDLDQGSRGYDWSNDTYDDKVVNGLRLPLKSPFTSQYDRQPWSQPMQDLADINRMMYSISREGFPIFAPINKKLRGIPKSSNNIAYRPGGHSVPVPGGQFINDQGYEVADGDTGIGEWHLAYGGSIDNYTHTIDSSGVLSLVYVSCQTAFGDEITFTIPAAGTGISISDVQNENTTEHLVQYSNQVGNKEGLQLTCGAQQTDAVSLDNLLLGLDWNTQPASWGLTLSRGADHTLQVDAQPPIPNPSRANFYFESAGARRYPNTVKQIQQCCNFFMERRYIGAAVYDQFGHTVYAPQLNVNGLFTGTDGKALQSAITQLQQFLTGQNSALNTQGYNLASGGAGFTLTKTSDGAFVGRDGPGVWGKATYKAVQAWITASSYYIQTDVWWYVQNGLPWDQYVAAIVGLNIPQIPSNSSGTDGSGTSWQIDQNALKTEAQDWMKQFFHDAINYGNSVVDDSINKATQKVINTNMADPRIQLGDVIWAQVPGYLSSANAFGDTVAPFLNGVYVTGVTRSMDLQQGTYTGSYSGYRYRGNFESNITTNVSNYCSVSSKI